MVPQVENELENFGAVTVVDDSKSADEPNLKGDWLNIFLLLLLYTIQGIVYGLLVGIPLLLQINKNVTYKDQALFSLAFWPLSLKLIWAPLVDSLYVQKMGRRKSWLIPVQYLIGVCFIYMSYNIDEWLPETGKPDIPKLLYVIFFIQCLGTTQDIVVDGWALTMLKRNNVGYASSCNEIGQKFGIMISTLFIVVFTSENFCHEYLGFAPGTGGIVTRRNLFYVWGILFMFITTLIAIFKKEKDNRLEENYIKLNIIQNYLLLLKILKQPSIQVLLIALFTVEMGFAASLRNVPGLNLIDAGVSKDTMVVIRSTMYVVKMIIPFFVLKYTTGPKPMSIFLKVIPIRIIWNITFAVLIYYTTTFKAVNETVHFPIHYYIIVLLTYIINGILFTISFVAKIALFNRISDPRFGGTYMTLFITFTNMGLSLSTSVAFALIDFLTVKECSLDFKNNCSTSNLKNTCKTNGGSCIITVNGYYVETALCILIGIVWYCIFKSVLKKAQVKNSSYWWVNMKKCDRKNETIIYSMVENPQG